MKTLQRMLLVVVVLAGQVSAGEVREWTGARSLKIKGEFVELKDNRVVIRTEDGQLTEVPVMQLSVQDQLYARKLAQQPKKSGAATTGTAAILPHFKDGKWAGEHAFYETAKMDVVITTNGFPTIYLKDGGKRVGPPIRTGWGIYYYTEKDVQVHYRQVERFLETLPPGPIKERFRYKCICQDKDKVELDLRFEDNVLEVGIEFVEPSSVKYAGTFNFGISIPGTHSFPDGTPLEKIARELTGYSLRFKEYNRHEVVYDYHPHVTLTNTIVSAEIKGPWGPRVLKIEQPRQGALNIGNYVLTPLYAGYGINKYLGSGSKVPPIRFTVE